MAMFVNTLCHFADHEVSVSIPVKSYTVSAILIPQSKAMLVGILTVAVLPLGSLLLGFVIWFRRRRR